MSVSVTVRLDQAAIDRLTSSTSNYGQVYLPAVGNRMVNAAKRRANVRTGLMRSTITFRVVPGSPASGELAANTRYSYWVHNGNGRYPGNPFLTDAVREVLR